MDTTLLVLHQVMLLESSAMAGILKKIVLSIFLLRVLPALILMLMVLNHGSAGLTPRVTLTVALYGKMLDQELLGVCIQVGVLVHPKYYFIALGLLQMNMLTR